MTALAEADTPLKLADGTLVYPSGRIEKNKPTPQLVEVPTNSEAQRIVAQTRRRIADLPAVPRSMNAISVVLVYKLFGLDDVEICIAAGITEQQLATICMSEAYDSVQREMLARIVESDASTVRDLFVTNAKNAAKKMLSLVDNDEPAVALAASRDVLDRAGHRPADIIELRHKLDATLRIEYIDKRGDKELPTIDITPTVE